MAGTTATSQSISSTSSDMPRTKTLYPSNWPANPFHKGEIQVQKLLGAEEHVMSYAPRVIRPYMPDQHRDFFEAQPFLVIAARDVNGQMWSSFLAAAPASTATTTKTTSTGNQDHYSIKRRMTKSPDPFTLLIEAQPAPGDALEEALKQPGTDIGILGIEFTTKRRNRVNGRITHISSDEKTLTFHVDQSFGNCPQYIKPRQWWTPTPVTSDNGSCRASSYTSKPRQTHLSEEQMAKIRQAETIFLASGYRQDGAENEDPRFGNDASHRGGPSGFVHVKDNRTLVLPDFSGNNHFNTIGNLILDNRIGVSFPEYETGAMIQVTGRAQVNFDVKIASSFYPGAERLIEIRIDEVNQLPGGSIPIRWTTATQELQQRSLVVSGKIQESSDVMSFYLKPPQHELQNLWKFSPGQHLPILIAGMDPLNNDSVVQRTYSLSAGPSWDEYRISVKRQGLCSNFLHDQVRIGDMIQVQKPAGDFVLDLSKTSLDDDSFSRTIVLLSNGIGITPMISMLHHWAECVVRGTCSTNQKVYWIHGARNSRQHPFTAELKEIQNLLGKDALALETHVAYSQPMDGDQFNSKGRLNVAQLAEIVPCIDGADIYMCGTHGFIAEMEKGLVWEIGVPASQIHYETF